MAAPGLGLLSGGTSRGRERLAAGLSAALHVLTALALSWRPVPALPDEVPPIEVELIDQAALVRGAAPSTAAPPPAPEAVPRGDGREGARAPSPATPQPPGPEINLGNGLEDRDPLRVTGDNIRPPAPDSRFRNLPPRYPAAAARVGAEGTVQLVIHVTSLGLPSAVAVVRSSGNEALDAEARRALMLWRFKPAMAGGRPVPFDVEMGIHFSMEDR